MLENMFAALHTADFLASCFNFVRNDRNFSSENLKENALKNLKFQN